MKAKANATPNAAESDSPRAVRPGSIKPAIAGSAMKPRTSVVTVMPSCAPDSMKLSR